MLMGIYAATWHNVAVVALVEGLHRCGVQAAARNLDYWRGEVEDFARVIVEDADNRGRGVRDAYQDKGIAVVAFWLVPDGRLRVVTDAMMFDPWTLEEVRAGEGLRAMLGQFADGRTQPAVEVFPFVTTTVSNDGLDNLDVAQLRALAKARGVSVPTRAGVDRLRAILRQAQVPPKP